MFDVGLQFSRVRAAGEQQWHVRRAGRFIDGLDPSPGEVPMPGKPTPKIALDRSRLLGFAQVAALAAKVGNKPPSPPPSPPPQ